ncbi:MAG TPA: HAD family hydrolase [Chloroflexia bacterium]|nr:HAD family hydrolase [Chloroflexia bacterium]
MRRLAAPRIRLLVLDGDHTLWQPLDIICASERYADDPEGGTAFRFQALADDPDTIIRDDGVRFALMPGARALLERLHGAGVRLAIASYNHAPPIVAMLEAFGLLPLFGHVVASWSSDKGAMLRTILAAEPGSVPEETLFVDDDPYGIYRPMAAAIGVRFAQMGNPAEVVSFGDIARLADAGEEGNGHLDQPSARR